MNTKLIAEALGKLDDSYVEEALNYRCAAKRHTWAKWGAAAACFAVICAAALVFAPVPANPGLDEPIPAPPSPAVTLSQQPEITAPPSVSVTPSPSPEPEALHISLENIAVNETGEPVSAARLYFDPALYDTVVWDQDRVIDYYGRDLTPAYVPAGLDPFDGNGTTEAIIRKEDNAVVLDTVYYSYYQAFGTWEDGTPRYIGVDPVVRHGFHLAASKVGILNCGIVYLGPEDEVKSSDIAGTAVTIGYRAMSHGPYDPDTHEPAGYYDLYVAEFVLDNAAVQIVAEQLTLEEVVKIAASVIAPGQEIVFDT